MSPAARVTAIAVASLLVGTPGLEASQSVRSDRGRWAIAQPVKDCTRFNGRHGYYGNPWCTPAEQRRFDIWEVKRLGR